MDLRVAKRFRSADGTLRVWVGHPGGGSLTVSATWTNLEAPTSEKPLTRGRVRDDTWHCASFWRIFRVAWGRNGRMDREFGSLQQMIDWLECRARWKSVPAADRERAVEALAEMLLQAVEGEDEGQAEDSPEAS
ncbi:MAG: hypothetical protein OXH99_07400 [Bryobacterales bacterium]|nr:hypothetical protein [Bryobacterales bacterium]